MLFRCLASAVIIGTCSGAEDYALMQSQTRNEDALEFVDKKEQTQMGDLHKSVKQIVDKHFEHKRAYHAHLTKHHRVTGAVASIVESDHANTLKKTAQQLEHEYRTILEMMIAEPPKGDEYLPPKDLMESVKDIFTTIQGELEKEALDGQKMIDDANTVIQACNDTLTSAFTTSILGNYADSNTARTNHRTCRDSENTLICDTKTACDKFNAMDRCGANSALGKYEQDYYAKVNVASAEHSLKSLRATITNAKSCRSKLNTEHVKARECDGKQETFEGNFCTFEQSLRDASDSYYTCDVAARKVRREHGASVLATEMDNKLIWNMTKKVDCYLDILKETTYTDKIPLQGQLDSCTAYNPDDSPLDITYTPPIDNVNVTVLETWEGLISTWPGKAGEEWSGAEYAGDVFHLDCKKNNLATTPAWQRALTTDKLQAVTACIHYEEE